jgi:hypothetical protein
MTTESDHCQLTLRTYESLAAKSEAMLAAAQRSDWHAVVAIERDCDQILRRLCSVASMLKLDQQTRARRSELMHRIVTTDAAVRELSQPWAQRLEHRLRAAERLAEDRSPHRP